MTAVRPVQLPLPEQDTTFDTGGIEEDDYIEISFEEKTALHAHAIDESITHRQKQQLQNRKKNGLLVAFIMVCSIHCLLLRHTQQKCH
jgi:hypothetical protein